MKKLLFILSVFLFCGCGRKKDAPVEEISSTITKLRTFIFVNSDSLKFYRDKLRHSCDPAIPAQNARLKYADALYNITAGIHNKALTDFKDASVIFEKEKDDSFLAYCYLGEANCYKLTGNADEAVLHYLKATDLFEKNHNDFYVNVCYANLAETYEEKYDEENARKYLKIAISKQAYGSKTYVSVLHLQANLYGMTGKTDSAMVTDSEGIFLAQKFHYPELISAFYDNMARCYTDWKQYDSADHYYRKCIYTDSLSGRIQLMADTYAQLVNVYGAQKQEAKMETMAAHAFMLCDSTQYLRGKYAVFEGLGNYYSTQKEWERAATVKDSMQSIYKRLINEQTESNIAEYNVAYETSKKEQLIFAQQNKLQKITYLSVILSLIALLLAISIFTLFRNYKAKRSIAISKAIQEQKDINVQTVFESEQQERIRIARDLHDSIGQKLSVIKMYLTGDESNFAKTPALLDETIQEVRNISHNLLPEELNFGLLKAINSDIEKIRQSGKFKVDVSIDEGAYKQIPLSASLNIVMVFRELLSNLVKHSSAEDITIIMTAANKVFTMQLTDDGNGINSEMIAESDGIGWKNIFARITMLKGNIVISGNEPHGNIVTIKIPFA